MGETLSMFKKSSVGGMLFGRAVRVALCGVSLLVSQCTSPQAHAADGVVVFYLDKRHMPVVRLDRLPSPSESMKALLALYALENGAGCEGKNEDDLVRCALTAELGLGANCSEEHIRLVRSWFVITPNLTSRWNERWNAKAKESGSLEGLCYGQPDTASWHNTWEIIRVRSSGEAVNVEAIQFWGSQHGHGRVRYRNSYKVGPDTITEVSSQVVELSRSSESVFDKGGR
jgi:hypothetical protein